MSAENTDKKAQEPRGLGEHARGPAAENAHELGWDLNEEERTRVPQGHQNTYGGTDYDYGARDFGDDPVDTSSASVTPQTKGKLLQMEPNPKKQEG